MLLKMISRLFEFSFCMVFGLVLAHADDQLYPSNHVNYGTADQVGWRNTRNYKVGFEIELAKRISAQFDINDFYLATLQDYLYSDNGPAVLINAKASSKHVGWEPDLQVSYKANNRLTIGAVFARLNCGAFLKQSTQGRPFSYSYIYWEYQY
jgi:hypothetical protein